MSHTELQRAIKLWKGRKEQCLSFIQLYLAPLFKLHRLQGVVVDQNDQVMPGVCVMLDQFRSCYTDEDGYFYFYFLKSKKYKLSMKCQGIELCNWLHVTANSERNITELKLRWPQLIRGQLFDHHAQGMPQVQVRLNEQYKTYTDIQGIFLFPKHDREGHRFDSFRFTLNDQEFLHHFYSTQQDVMHRFCFDQHQLLYVDQSAMLSPCLKSTRHYLQSTQKFLGAVFFVILLIIMSIFQAESSPMNIEITSAKPHLITSTYGKIGLPFNKDYTVINEDQLKMGNLAVSLSSLPQSQKIPLKKLPMSLAMGDIEMQESEPCKMIEFTYYHYYVPRGMEGILLSLVFGHWQNWSNDLSVMNKMNKSDQLQAGQRIKFHLPIYHWKTLKVKDKTHIDKLLQYLPCKQELFCTQLIQAWNPHVDVRFLRKNDTLLINTKLLSTLPFTHDTLKRIEKVKRFRRSRRKSPRLKLPKNCTLNRITY